MTPQITPYFDPNQMPPWLRGGSRLSLGGVLGAPPMPAQPPMVGQPPTAMPGNMFNSGSLLRGPMISNPMPYGGPTGPPAVAPGPGAMPMPPVRPAPVAGPLPGSGMQPPMPDPVGGPGGFSGPYQPLSQNLNPMAGMAPGRPRMSRPGMASTA